MSNIATLKPFKKGEKRTKEMGRKGGKTPKVSFKKSLIEILFKAKTIKKYNKVAADKLIFAWMERSKRNPQFAKLILQLNNELKEVLEHSGPDGGPIETINLSKAEYKKMRQEMLKHDDV